MAEFIIAKDIPKKQARKVNIVAGDRFGRLTVIEESPPYISPRGVKLRKARFLCDCGNIVEAVYSRVFIGRTKSCGCLQRDILQEMIFVHGLREHPIYNIWVGMKSRCNNPNDTAYHHYGLRDIHICQEWEYDFKAFFDWAVSNGWNEKVFFDRIDVTKGYSPDNCRFIDRCLSARNQRLLRKSNTSGFRGVCFSKENKKWGASITNNGKRYFLGYFTNSEEAARAYDTKAKELNSEHPQNFTL